MQCGCNQAYTASAPSKAACICSLLACLRPAGGRRKKKDDACLRVQSKVTAAGDAETNPSFWSEDGNAGGKEGEVATLVIIRPAARPGAAEQKERDGLLLLLISSESVPAGASDRARHYTLHYDPAALVLHDSAFRIFSIVVALSVLFSCFFQVWS
jgi:hypothetical protein